jgi:hypothetical protein
MTKLVEFSPIGRLLSFGSFSTITKVGRKVRAKDRLHFGRLCYTNSAGHPAPNVVCLPKIFFMNGFFRF